MRKIIVFSLLVIFALATTGLADTGNVAITEYSIYFRNNTATHADYLVPTTTVRPNVDKITGYNFKTLATAGANPETWVSIFDSTNSLMTGECFGEFEANGSESIHDKWPRGRNIFNGIALRVGSFTEGLLHFRRD